MKNDVELLSPAGSFDCGVAAFTYGADAIYLGLKNFSARADAMNFSFDELRSITKLAHGLGKKIYVAVNTLVQNSEISDVVQSLAVIDDAGVDAVIIQDLGVANIIKKYFPNLQMHASTQMAVHNLEGAIALKNFGFSRVVLARELGIDEIENITKNCGIETEVFIHGALCYSYSGLCMYSSFRNGESANRGKCSYPCRQMYSGTHPYSMKDLSIGDYVLRLSDAGVASLKIEGRKKTPLYVAATADYYRRLLDGCDVKNCLENIQKIFARPYTDLHFNGKNKDVIDRDFSGPRGVLIGCVEKIKNGFIKFKTSHRIEKRDGILITVAGIEKPFGFSVDKMFANDDFVYVANPGDFVEIKMPDDYPNVNVGDSVYCSSSSVVKSSYPFKLSLLEEKVVKPKIDILFEMNASAMIVSSGKISCSISGCFDKSNNPEKMREGVMTALSKLGDSDYQIGNLDYKNDGYFAPISMLNDLRRDFVSKLNICDEMKIPEVIIPKNDVENLAPGYVIKVDDISYLESFSDNDLQNIFEIIIDIDCDFSEVKISKDKVRVALPVVNRPNEMLKIKDKIRRILGLGFGKFSIANISGFQLMKEFSITDFICDFYMYSMNNFAVDFLLQNGAGRVTISPEDSKKNMAGILESFLNNSDLIIYADVPVFISDNCLGDCKNCKSTDDTIIKNCRHYIFDNSKYCIANKTENLHAKNYRMDFCFKKYSLQEVYGIYKILIDGKCPSNTVLANFNRGFE